MEQTPRTVEIHTYLPQLIALTEQGQQVTLPVSGGSMAPFLIPGRDWICFQKPDGRLKRGDIAFFQRKSGEYILHRVCRAAEQSYDLVGDGQREVEGPILPEQIFGVVTRVRWKGRWIGPEDFWWRFFSGPWLTLLPLRPLLRRGYAVWRRIWK